MDDWDPLNVLMVKGFGYLVFVAIVLWLLYLTVKYAVRDGMRLALDDERASRTGSEQG